MIEMQTSGRESRTIRLNPAAIASINDPLEHQHRNGVRAVVTTMNGDVYELRDHAHDIAAEWAKQSAK